MSTLNFIRRRARERATFVRLAGTYYNAFDEAGTRQWISNALNCIQNFFRAANDEASYALFFTLTLEGIERESAQLSYGRQALVNEFLVL